MKALVLVAASFLLIVNLAIGEDQKSWLGESIIYKKHPNQIAIVDRMNGKTIELVLSGQLPIKVIEDRGERLRILDTDQEGWVDRADFVLASQAQAYFNERVKEDPKNVWALLMRGIGENQLGNFDVAIKDFTDCIRLDAKYEEAYLNRAFAWEGKKDYDKAIKDLDEVIRLNPDYSMAFFNRGNAWSKKKVYEKAIKDYDEAMRLDPKDASAFDNKAFLLATCPTKNIGTWPRPRN
jgi:tetratricopeptide (TPR) repeat protein